MQTKNNSTNANKVLNFLKKNYFHIILLALFTLPIGLLAIIDYLNIESFPINPAVPTNFNQKFIFEETWKGRMFYIFFVWLLFLEFIIDYENIEGKQPKNPIRKIAFIICALLPTIYILSVNRHIISQLTIPIKRIDIHEKFSTPFHWPTSIEPLLHTIITPFTNYIITPIINQLTTAITTTAIYKEFCIPFDWPTSLRPLALTIMALLPTSQTILELGKSFHIHKEFIPFHWPLSFEYLILTLSFIMATIFAYKKAGLKTFAISLSLMTGITTFYMLDTVYPLGIFKPLQLLTLPTTGVTAAFCEILGYETRIRYPITAPGYGVFPRITIVAGRKSAYADIGWPCAGVHSMFLYMLIILVFFKKSDISNFRKVIYFIIGAAGTFMANILRIYSYLIIALNNQIEAQKFHDKYGELYFFTWMLLYLITIICIQKFKLVEKTRTTLHKLGMTLRNLERKARALFKHIAKNYKYAPTNLKS